MLIYIGAAVAVIAARPALPLHPQPQDLLRLLPHALCSQRHRLLPMAHAASQQRRCRQPGSARAPAAATGLRRLVQGLPERPRRPRPQRQRYHKILADFKADIISIQTAYLRLAQLEKDSQALDTRIAGRTPPLALNDFCYDQSIELVRKAHAYADAQHRAIALTRAAATRPTSAPMTRKSRATCCRPS